MAYIFDPKKYDGFHPDILRKYDIRGRVGETLKVDDVFAAGLCFADLVQEQGITTVAVCRDGRLSSPEFETVLMEAITSRGVNILQIGVGPTPLLYYVVKEIPSVGAGIMITGSHNDARYNGLKMLLKDKPIWGEEIQGFRRRYHLLLTQESIEKNGMIRSQEFYTPYIQRLLKGMTLSPTLKVVWDCGNGATGPVVQSLVQHLPGQHILLYEKVDGTFPHHHPDPTVANNMKELREAVLRENADVGIGFDGDGDRIGVITRTGRLLLGDQLMVLYGRDLLKKHPGATILVDVKTSRWVLEDLKHRGGEPRLCATGHSSIKAMMKETGALLAGELSGHIFFADDYYGYDDALYASLRLLNLLKEGSNLETLLSDMPLTYQTPEIGIACPDAVKFRVMENIKARLQHDPDGQLITLDGIRMDYADGWWLLRASNTESILTARAEALSAERLQQFLEHLEEMLASENLKLPKGKLSG